MLRKEVHTTASVLNFLVVENVAGNQDCFVTGADYVLKIQFKFALEKNWKIELNGARISNLENILVKGKLNATVRIKPNLYVNKAGYSDAHLNITIFDSLGNLSIHRLICSRIKTEKVTVSVPKAVSPLAPMNFYVQSRSITGSRNICINFGDGSNETKVSYRPTEGIAKVYASVGTYVYKWRVVGISHIAMGSGGLNVLNPILASSVYVFPRIIEQNWPFSNVSFYIGQKCGYPSPSGAFYRLSFGDGESTPWTAAPRIDCSKKMNLAWHVYKLPGCHFTRFEMRNALGRCEIVGKVLIHQTINSLRVDVRSVLASAPLELEKDGIKEIRVPDEAPFNVSAVTTGGRCRNFEWRILKPYWLKKTFESNSVIVDHLLNKPGTYDVHVKVFNNKSNLTQRLRLVLTRSLGGLILLTSIPNEYRKVSFYILLQDAGLSPTLNLTFGDGKFSTEINPNFTAAENLPNIKNISMAEKRSLDSLLGIYKEYRYSKDGVYSVVVTANDSFRNLNATRTLLISHKICLRPKVEILLGSELRRFVLRVGEAFTILSNVDISCGDYRQAVFQWQLFSSSERDMKKYRPAESDKSLR